MGEPQPVRAAPARHRPHPREKDGEGRRDAETEEDIAAPPLPSLVRPQNLRESRAANRSGMGMRGAASVAAAASPTTTERRSDKPRRRAERERAARIAVPWISAMARTASRPIRSVCAIAQAAGRIARCPLAGRGRGGCRRRSAARSGRRPEDRGRRRNAAPPETPDDRAPEVAIDDAAARQAGKTRGPPPSRLARTPRATRPASARSRMAGASSTDNSRIHFFVSAASARAASFASTRSSAGSPVGAGSITASARGSVSMRRANASSINAAPAAAQSSASFRTAGSAPRSSVDSRMSSSANVSMAQPGLSQATLPTRRAAAILARGLIDRFQDSRTARTRLHPAHSARSAQDATAIRRPANRSFSSPLSIARYPSQDWRPAGGRWPSPQNAAPSIWMSSWAAPPGSDGAPGARAAPAAARFRRDFHADPISSHVLSQT